MCNSVRISPETQNCIISDSGLRKSTDSSYVIQDNPPAGNCTRSTSRGINLSKCNLSRGDPILTWLEGYPVLAGGTPSCPGQGYPSDGVTSPTPQPRVVNRQTNWKYNLPSYAIGNNSSVVVACQNVPITSTFTDFTAGPWKDFDVDRSLIGSTDLIWITYFVTPTLFWVY